MFIDVCKFSREIHNKWIIILYLCLLSMLTLTCMSIVFRNRMTILACTTPVKFINEKCYESTAIVGHSQHESYYKFTEYSQCSMNGVFITSHGKGSSTVFDIFGLTQILVKPKTRLKELIYTICCSYDLFI
jgi:hypothetical protein